MTRWVRPNLEDAKGCSSMRVNIHTYEHACVGSSSHSILTPHQPQHAASLICGIIALQAAQIIFLSKKEGQLNSVMLIWDKVY